MNKENNPFLSKIFPPDFNAMTPEAADEAITFALNEARQNISKIEEIPQEKANFANVIRALDNSSTLLDEVWNIANHIESVSSSPEMREVLNRRDAEVSDFSSSICINGRLWEKIKAVRDSGVKFEGEEKIPKGRFVLIQNHLAMFDPIATIAYLGKYEIGFITKPENFRLPIINKFMHRICCIAIDRENARNAVKSINAAAENVKNDICSMAIYPEGTRARDGKMLPFHSGSFKIATKSGAPLVITTVDNTNLVHKNAPFRRTKVTLRICEVISAEEVSSSTTAELSKKAYRTMLESLGSDKI